MASAVPKRVLRSMAGERENLEKTPSTGVSLCDLRVCDEVFVVLRNGERAVCYVEEEGTNQVRVARERDLMSPQLLVAKMVNHVLTEVEDDQEQAPSVPPNFCDIHNVECLLKTADAAVPSGEEGQKEKETCGTCGCMMDRDDRYPTCVRCSHRMQHHGRRGTAYAQNPFGDWAIIQAEDVQCVSNYLWGAIPGATFLYKQHCAPSGLKQLVKSFMDAHIVVFDPTIQFLRCLIEQVAGSMMEKKKNMFVVITGTNASPHVSEARSELLMCKQGIRILSFKMLPSNEVVDLVARMPFTDGNGNMLKYDCLRILGRGARNEVELVERVWYLFQFCLVLFFMHFMSPGPF